MAVKKTTRTKVKPETRKAGGARKVGRRFVPRASKAASPAARAAELLRERWDATVQALGTAEAAVEKRVRTLMKNNRINPKDASVLVDDLRLRIGRERKKLVKQVGTRVKDVQGRLKKERKVVGRRIDETVRAALSALNIPSRREVAELTAKVDALSKKIDSLRR